MKEKLKSLEETFVSFEAKEEFTNLKSYLTGLGVPIHYLQWKDGHDLKLDFNSLVCGRWVEKSSDSYVHDFNEAMYRIVSNLDD